MRKQERMDPSSAFVPSVISTGPANHQHSVPRTCDRAILRSSGPDRIRAGQTRPVWRTHRRRRQVVTTATGSMQSAARTDVVTAALDGEGTSFEEFERRANSAEEVNLVPVWRRVFSDHMTPVTLYRCLVAESDVEKASYLLESVTTSGNVGRYSFVGADPAIEVIAKEANVTIVDRRGEGEPQRKSMELEDPWAYIKDISAEFKPAKVTSLPNAFSGGWVGYGAYDSARYVEGKVLPFSAAPTDDRGLPDLHMSIFRQCVTFDHISKICYIVSWVDVREHDGLKAAYNAAMGSLSTLVAIHSEGVALSPLSVGMVDIDAQVDPEDPSTAKSPPVCTMTKQEYLDGVEQCKWHIREGDAFQIVLSQRFERKSKVHPFSVYRALRIINPSPYMIYMQCKGTILVASSPEILCRVEDHVVTNRPLAGTRRRGRSPEEDRALEEELLQDEKDLAEHRMLVDLGRNDVGRVAKYGSVKPLKLMEVERYSHVMHLSSTVVGTLSDELSSFDALAAALPAGTVSGAPKIRAMQIIDTLEPTRRGPYGGGIGVISFDDRMNIALALRTMVIPTQFKTDDGVWTYHLQAGAGIVADSVPEDEHKECINKARAMNRAIDLSERAFNGDIVLDTFSS